MARPSASRLRSSSISGCQLTLSPRLIMGARMQVYQQVHRRLAKHAADTHLHILVTRDGGHPNPSDILTLLKHVTQSLPAFSRCNDARFGKSNRSLPALGKSRSFSMKAGSAFMLCGKQSGESSFDAVHENERDGCGERTPLLGRRLELERHLRSPDAITRFQHEVRRVNLVGTRADGAVPFDDLLVPGHLVLGQRA